MKRFAHTAFIFVCLVLCFSCNNDKHRILYVNSYHQGYPPSDEVMQALKDNLSPDSFEVRVEFLNSKNQSSEDSLKKSVEHILETITEFQPEIIAVSDDNAIKFLVEPYAQIIGIPFVFCGVNWSAEQYKLDKKLITGMLEVLPLKEALQSLKQGYPTSKKLAILSENSLSEINNTKLLDTLYRNLGFTPQYFLVDSFSQWKSEFLKASEECDIIYLPTNGAVKNWNNSEAKKFVSENIIKPVFTCDEFMMQFSAVGLTKVPAEQGRWVATTIKTILQGEAIESIPQAKNIENNAWVNSVLAGKIKFPVENTVWSKANTY